jgi:lipoprotein-anchoring transpeptidase ErfK/SrfK
MTRLKTAVAVALTALLSLSNIAPVSAARVFNADTATWEEPSVAQARGKRGSAIKKQIVDYETKLRPGTIVVETGERRLYFVLADGKAIKYGIGVGRDGFTWTGILKITRKAEWPDWTPPEEMITRQPYLPRWMAGGPGNPLGARAMYLGATVYRIHGTNAPETIGQAVSSGCFRLVNDDVSDLYQHVKVGTKVVVRH